MSREQIYKNNVYVYLFFFVFNTLAAAAISKYLLDVPPNLFVISFVSLCFFLHNINKEEPV